MSMRLGIGLCSGLLMLAGGCSEGGLGRADQSKDEWKLAVMTYTFNRYTLFDSIDKTEELGVNYLETYSWQPISAEHGDLKFNPKLPDEVIEEVKQKCADSDIDIVNYYYHHLGKDEAESRKVFEFCKKAGIETIIGEPQPEHLERVDRLAQEYEVQVAIHNHKRDPNNPDYAYWNPHGVMKALKGRSKWLGACADTGHWVRSGNDPVECLKVLEGRLISMHLKDVNEVGPQAHDVPYGMGVAKMRECLVELDRQGFKGVFSIEYEHNMEDNMADVAQCIAWFNKTRAELGR